MKGLEDYLYYHEDGPPSITIYKGDCLDILPLLPKVDLVVTDPPYNIGFNGYDIYHDEMPDEDYINLIASFQGIPTAISTYPEEMMKYIVPALGVPNKVLAWCYASNMERRNFRLINCYGVEPDFSRVKQPYRWPNDKRVALQIKNGSEGANIYDWFTDINLVRNVSSDKTEHPCQVPVELQKRLITLMSDEGQTVLEPFCGSGSTLVACKELKRNGIGIEISERYCEIARKRLQNTIVPMF